MAGPAVARHHVHHADPEQPWPLLLAWSSPSGRQRRAVRPWPDGRLGGLPSGRSRVGLPSARVRAARYVAAATQTAVARCVPPATAAWSPPPTATTCRCLASHASATPAMGPTVGVERWVAPDAATGCRPRLVGSAMPTAARPPSPATPRQCRRPSVTAAQYTRLGAHRPVAVEALPRTRGAPNAPDLPVRSLGIAVRPPIAVGARPSSAARQATVRRSTLSGEGPHPGDRSPAVGCSESPRSAVELAWSYSWARWVEPCSCAMPMSSPARRTVGRRPARAQRVGASTSARRGR